MKRTCKVKKIPSTLRDKEFFKNAVKFISCYSKVLGMQPTVVCFPRETTLEKTSFSFVRG